MLSKKKNYKKRLFAVITAMLLVIQCLIISPISIFAANATVIKTVNSGDYQYEILNDDTVRIKKFTNSTATSVKIPKVFQEKPITAIGDSAFLNLTNIKNITIPDTINIIGNMAFRGTGINQITIPGSIRNIGNMAFFNCKSLQTVYILYGVETIGDAAFGNCTSLDTVAISPSVTKMTNKSFEKSDGVEVQGTSNSVAGQYTSTLTTIKKAKLSDDSPVVYDYEIGDDDKAIIKGYYGESLTPEIPNKISDKETGHIAEGAFKDKPITAIKLPDTLTTIGANAFANTKVTVVTVPDNVTAIGKGAFDDTENLVLKGSSTALDEYISQTQNIKFVPYGPGLTAYHNLEILNSGNGSLSAGRSGMYKNGSKITLKAKANSGYNFQKWTVLGEGSIDNVNDIETVFNMPDVDTSIKVNFEKSRLVIENGVVLKYYGSGALIIPEEWGKEGTDDPNKVPVTSISSNVFYDAGNPTSIKIPKTVVTIPNSMFHQYTNNYCSNLTSIEVDENNPNYSSVDGVLFNKDKSILIKYPSNKAEATYTIPDTVKSIDANAFYRCRNLTSVILQNGLTDIGNQAFYECYKLTSISFPETLVTIGSSVFYDCRSLTNIVIPSSVTSIGSSAFYGCSGLINIVISSSVTSIGSQAFYNCSKLVDINVDANNTNYSSVDGVLFDKNETTLIVYPIGKTELNYIIPNNVINIASHAFAYCTNLTSIQIPEGLTSIGSYAFAYCTNLISANIPSSVTTIGSYAFVGCSKLQTIIIPDGVTTIDSSAFSGCSEVTQIVIPSSVTSIGSKTFYNCSKLQSITVDANNPNYSHIDGVLFNKNKTRLIVYPMAKTDITYDIPVGVTAIDSHAFYNCDNLTAITIPVGVTAISDYTFNNCSNLTSITVPEGITNIGYWAFGNCSNLSNLVLPESLTSIDSYAFYYCSKLVDVILPENVKYINSYAFYGCNSLNTITIYNRNMSFSSSYIFNNKSNLIIKGYLGSTSELYAYNNNIKFEQLDEFTEGLIIENGVLVGYTGTDTEIVLPNKTTDENIAVTTIGNNAFKNPNNSASEIYKDITSVKIPLSFTKIDASAFEGCYSLTSEGIKLPISIKEIGIYAFEDCKGLTTINIPKNVTTIAKGAFYGSTNLTSITVDSANKSFASVGGILTNKDKTTLKEVPNGFAGDKGDGRYDIPEGITSIEDSAFNGCININQVYIRYIKFIGTGAFKNAFKYPIDVWIFDVEDIGNNAFEGCTGIKSISIPKTVLRIGDNVFDGCTNLLAIGVDPANPIYSSKNGILFTNKESEYKKQLIKYPQAKSGICYTIPEDVIAIYKDAFSNNNLLNTVKIPANVIMIGSRAFDNCTVLESVYLTDGLEVIQNFAFANNNSLKEIEIPKTVTTLETGAFTNCNKLSKITIWNKNMAFGTEGRIFDEELITIYGFKDSTAQKYAQDNNIKFEEITSYPKSLSGLKSTSGVVGEKITLSATPNDNSNVAVNITDEQINAVVNNAKISNKDTVDVTVSTFVYTKAIEISLPKISLGVLVDNNTVQNLSINTSIANIKFDKASLDIIKKQATDNVIISIERLDTTNLTQDIIDQIGNREAFKLTISSGNTKISEFGGGTIKSNLLYFIESNNGLINY